VNYTPIDLESLVRQRAPEIARDIQTAAQKARNEADLVAAVERVIERFAKNFDVGLHLDRERTLVNGRADAVYNRFVVEYEPPGSLRKEPSWRHNKHAVEQVQRYLMGLERLDRHKKERLAGAVLDGNFYIFVRFRDNHWHVDDPVPVSPHSTETFLRYLLSLATELALTPENLVRDFGENTVVSRLAVPALYNALRTSDNPKVHILFHQWQRLFSEICGYEEGSTRLDLAKLAKSYGLKDEAISGLHLFFAIHTYYATFIKLLAVQIAHYYLVPKIGTGLAQVASSDTQRLRAYLQKMERGGVFTDFGIKNFLEGDFFGWYLDDWNPVLEEAVRRIIGDLANYSLVTLDVDPEETRDLLKQLYQNLMPKKLRHDLGEYYTPDWLAERLLNQLGVDGDPRKRLLDPACGSGTFLVLTIKRIRQYADEKMLPPADVLDKVLNNVVGFDLNPLAVISARTNYLLALGDLLPYRRGEISIPVYLADSIMTPTTGTDLFTQHAYSFNTAVGKFSVPRALVDARYIDPLADLLEESVSVGLAPDRFRARLLQTFPLDAAQDDAQVNVAVGLYEQLLELDRKQINGIWARIIKNAFAPLFQGRFDYVAGNPPWVNWANLPDEYRQEIAPLWQEYDLFPHTGLRARLGSAMDDISILMLYVAVDKFLKSTGKLGFVITQTVFKSEGGGVGFRKFRLGNRDPMKVIFVDDMSELQPFEGATNRTSVIVVQKGYSTTYPVQYGYWRKLRSGVSLSTNAGLEEILDITKVSKWVAKPVNPASTTSPWLTGKARALDGLSKCIGESTYQARMGVHCHGNSAYWLEIIGIRPDGLYVVTNLPEAGRNKLESVQTALESRFVYPLLRGKDVQQWTFNSTYYILLPHDPEQPNKAYPLDRMQTLYPRTYSYIDHFKDFLERRSGYRQFFNPDVDPYYSLYNVGDYTFAPFKVVWRYIVSEFTCAVVSNAAMPNGETKTVIPETKLVLVPFVDEQEAHYLCACLSSTINRFLVKSYAVNIQIATHVLNYIAVPQFDPNYRIHRQLASLSRQAHERTAAGDTAGVREIEAEIDRLAAELWGLTEGELREIQESLAELK